QNAVFPFSNPITGVNGKKLRDVVVPRSITVQSRSSTLIVIVKYGTALEWKPERWLLPLPQTFTEAEILGVCSHL
ncbi:hypothetical protein BJ138DRAFT_1216436, partial [Hygrophoropsis aurantiaca]